MNILINNVTQSTYIFLGLFLLALILTFRKKKDTAEVFSVDLTQELKGLAILAIVFSHIGYCLVSDHRFLFPLTIAAGVGVNLFLLLSGYGLTVSALSKKMSPLQFYRRRLSKLYIPFWLVFLVFLALDFFINNRAYSLAYIGQSLLGFFPSANIFDLNSPFWYFTWIIFYYLLFPLVFSRKYPWLSAIALYLAGYSLISWHPAFLDNVMWLYKVHILAFPLGVLIASLIASYKNSRWQGYINSVWSRMDKFKLLKTIAYWISTVLLLGLIAYNAYYSHVGDSHWMEEAVSILTAGLVIIFFLIKKVENRLLYWFGFYSYEIYLFHWPIMSRFDIFYRFWPAWLATVSYLALFLGLGWLMRWLTNKIKL